VTAKSFESRLKIIETVVASRNVQRRTKMERDQAVREALKAITPSNRDEMLEAAL
jgi:hypothetical protein